MGSERLPAKALRCYICRKRNQGRHPKKWMHNVNEDMEAKKLTVQLTSNGSGVGQKQMETWSSSIIIIEMMEESRERDNICNVSKLFVYLYVTTDDDDDDDT